MFCNIGISSKNHEVAIAGEDELFKYLHGEIDFLRAIQLNFALEDIKAALLTGVYVDVSVVHPSNMDAQVLAEFLETDNISNEVGASNKFVHVPTECPAKTDLLKALEFLQKFS